MLHPLNRITKPLLKCFLVFFSTTILLSAQEKKSIPKIEKVYLHTDRTTYTLGESLWYKAYSVFAYNNLLYSDSNILYVELVSSDSKIMVQNKTQLVDGLGHGDFKLTDSVGFKAGVYQIRAYTNYIRNFGNDFVFKKEITVIDVFDKKSKETASESAPLETEAKPVKTVQKTFDVQFFPEGGSLVNNIESVVAFKAVDAHGMPITVQGKILDASGELVTFFGSLHDGMGKFQLKPLKGKQYHAEVSISDGTEIEAPLPKVIDTGYLLSLKKINNTNVVTIKTNEETLQQHPDAPVTLVCTTRGVSYLEGTQLLKETTLSFELPETDFPEGISQVTLYDAYLKPQSERLVYIDKEQDLEVALTTDKKQYKPSEKVTVHVTSKTKTGVSVPASYSLSCTDLNGVKNAKNYGTTISSYFLMESDIRGEVYNPSYYFDATNPKRLEHLDLLLLTQGWRDFLWKKLPKVNDSLAYETEKGFTISGRVKKLFGNRPEENNTVSLTLFSKSGMNGLNTITDANGTFKFKDLAFLGKTTMYLNSKNDKGKSEGMIELDTLNKKPMVVDFKKSTPIDSTQIDFVKKQVYKKYVMNGVAPENVLDEVEVIAKKPRTVENMNSDLFRGYVIDEESPSFADIFELLKYAIPTLDLNTTESIKFSRNTEPALIVVNQTRILDPDPDYEGALMVLDYVRNIMVDDVIKIEYDNSAVSTMIYGNQARNGVISITLKGTGDYDSSKKVFHSLKQQIEGFYNAREFYSFNSEKPSLELDNREKVRNTVYWNPYMHPDATGVSEASYYNTEVETNIKVSLEGITATGIPVVVHATYTIEK
ncbi:hypothetical protein ACFSKN_07875 [Mariniflexile gromovii]|uniref:MG2 domain-containing protein n=1 Tax=Mariniflexile gromovii TaxID=362523 RepID=A0ABS4BR78_9FLAO|nr:hypothetical protein [Mariniflexile gromovii]MBP0902923.1 hypothetical protein [Mariniflexile gromovii]